MATVKDWICRECGKRMTLRQAEKAVKGVDGCLGCGGLDIDLATPSEMKGTMVVDGKRVVDTSAGKPADPYYGCHPAHWYV